MSHVGEYELVVGDKGSTLIVTCKDRVTKAAINLTGKTAHLYYRLVAASGAVLLARTEKAMTIPTPTNGKAQYQWAAADLATVTSQGLCEFEVMLQKGASDELTSVEVGRLPVRARLT